jgi:hypothetical protein
MKKTLWSLWPFLILCLLSSGCATTITNLTPSTQRRNANGLYPFELDVDTTKYCIRPETMQAYVLIGGQVYPMQPTFMLTNRWETLIPVTSNREFVNYQFKVNYDYDCVPHSRPSSKLSPPYQLRISDRER